MNGSSAEFVGLGFVGRSCFRHSPGGTLPVRARITPSRLFFPCSHEKHASSTGYRIRYSYGYQQQSREATAKHGVAGSQPRDNRDQHESATHSHVAKLAAVKHARELAGRPESEWPRMVCDDDGYIEAIFVKNNMDLSAVVVVRVSQTEYDRLFDLAFTDYTQAHDDATHALKSDFVSILRASSEDRFTLESM